MAGGEKSLKIHIFYPDVVHNTVNKHKYLPKLSFGQTKYLSLRNAKQQVTKQKVLALFYIKFSIFYPLEAAIISVRGK